MQSETSPASDTRSAGPARDGGVTHPQPHSDGSGVGPADEPVADLWAHYRRAWRGEAVDLEALRRLALAMPSRATDPVLIALIQLLNDDLEPTSDDRRHP
jgi:hypothetical protein